MASLHHEKLDGSVYPFGVRGEALDARDALEALRGPESGVAAGLQTLGRLMVS
jgi:hypothetical protein